jgi:hypothetical protein
MPVIFPIPPEILYHLQLVINDLKLVKAAKLQAHRSQITLRHTIPEPAEDAHHAGMQHGLDMAIATLDELIERATETFEPHGTAQAQADAALKVAETGFALRAHGVQAPIASAAYSDYVQAHRALERARAQYVLFGRTSTTTGVAL